MSRLLAAMAASAMVWVWWPFPAPGADSVSDLIALNSLRLHAAIRTWRDLAPAVSVVMAWFILVAVGRVWLPGVRSRRGVIGRLPAWPVKSTDPAPALVFGELHHPVADREVASPDWLVIPELGLYTGILICGAIGSGKTSACMRPFARQLLGWQAEDRRRRAAGLVLEVKGDFCHQVRGILEEAGRREDYVELGLGGRWRWNPLGDDQLDSYSLAYTIASLINQLFGRSKEPFWQQAYVNLVRWIVELHRMRSERWVTLRDVYRCTLEPKRIEALIAEVEARVEAPVAVRIASTDFAAQVSTLGAWAWKGIGGGRLRTGDDRRLREQLASLGVAFEVEKAGRPGALGAARRGAALVPRGLEGARPEAALQHHRGTQRLPVGVRPAGCRRDLLPAEAPLAERRLGLA